MRHRTRAFTIVELLVVVSIIGLLLAILLPAIFGAKDSAQSTVSQANLRQLAVAHQSYASEWSGRQVTYILDSVASYGDSGHQAFAALTDGGITHPPIVMGRGYGAYGSADYYANFTYVLSDGPYASNVGLAQPIVFGWDDGIEYLGSFRLYNAAAFNQYVTGRFYDPVFYAPKDTAILDYIEPCLDDPGAFCIPPLPSDEVQVCALRLTPYTEDRLPAWSSYAMSPAAMFAPGSMSADGWRNPWSMPGGFRSPTVAQARYADLKTHMIEHNWLQGGVPDKPCNPGFVPGSYGGCEPYYFNHAMASAPFSLFYDGHVGSVGVEDAIRADARAQAQSGAAGLWRRDTPFGADGYLSEYAYDQAQTSFHILTTDGIRGRDITR